MRYRSLGTTGVKVSPLCLGAMMFGRIGNRDREECVRIIHRALDAGINFVDTADVYSAGESEEIVGQALAGRRDDIVLATKFHGPMGEDPNQQGNSRRWIIRAVENSLRRLGTDYIDLYQVHRPDTNTDLDDTLSALSDLVRQGKVRLGSSTFPAETIVEAQWAERRDTSGSRSSSRRTRSSCGGSRRRSCPRVSATAWASSPWSLQRWVPDGPRYRPGERRRRPGAARMPQRFDPERPGVVRKLELIPQLEEVADDAGMSLTHMALAFTLSHPAVAPPSSGLARWTSSRPARGR